ncbi:ribonuclease P [Sulfolobus sp. A20-N-F6]|uniref:ribonuclease P protein subunit n=1 Tax=Sulfolobaceae TaxID=118883 RepID=UPI0008461BED|nr:MULTISPECIES: ribonuclease P protein subunit [unclassified Sulfolobus]TRM74715.1 ribonuclease P [Sulfolobus sp. E5]TRM74934.1 ribonuclease P [Sulfolobus sp. A20-N-F8]TRM78954.1 ribonuclease P [Sulfolobus sp. B5]TRM81050.1 ribonuclease P [Sulfolobus sp. D5]TRM83126.1 ribonuclease P [Sulfolobus sp. A20-N-F6]TRM85579.1 ribonuclease P [Sulfolobus sp. F3]TRM86184.1 ribonuclease P [Sulfolobus sp. C3]TRM94846.1 ribonuclease P [Sulfolobus sp. A20-N-G8]TRN01763.1 ribonuclease P [Sulfolobus sp. E
MMIDYIGSRIRILYYTDPGLALKKGEIVFETERTFLVKLAISNRVITIFKSNGVFEITFKGKRFIIGGHKLVSKPWKRVR